MEEAEKKRVMILVIAAVIFIILIIMLNPAIKGYSVYSQIKKTNYSVEHYGMHLDDLERLAADANENLSNCRKNSVSLLNRIIETANQTTLFKSESEDLSKALEDFMIQAQEEKSRLREELTEKATSAYEEMDKMKEEIGILEDAIEDAARRTCCKAKVDDAEIDSYSIDDGRIVCGIGKENHVSCGFG